MAEWVADALRTVALSNQKSVYVGNAAPGTPYDGQHWVDISTDPPVVKVYDLTNTDWMTMYPVYYETQVGAWASPTQSPITNGTIVVLYNSTQAGSRLYARSNGAWVNMGGTLTRPYPVIDDTATPAEGDVGTTQIELGDNVATAGGGYEDVITTTVTASEDNTVICVAGGGAMYRDNSATTWTLRITLDGVSLDTETFTTAKIITMVGNATKATGTYDVKLQVDDDGDAGNIRGSGLHLYAFAVKT